MVNCQSEESVILLMRLPWSKAPHPSSGLVAYNSHLYTLLSSRFLADKSVFADSSPHEHLNA